MATIESEPGLFFTRISDGSSELPTLDLLSNDPLPFDLDELAARPASVPTESEAMEPSFGNGRWLADGDIWLDGEVVMCACPDCRAPISIRIWLMIADCWQCATSIALNEEQEREVNRLLRNREQQTPKQKQAAAVPVPGTKTHEPHREKTTPRQPSQRTAEPKQPTTKPQPTPPSRDEPSGRRDAAQGPSRAQVRIRKTAALSATRVWVTNFFKNMPAWIISGLLHLILLLLLALWIIEQKEEPRPIIMTTSVSRDREEGGVKTDFEIKDEVKFDLPVPKKDQPKDDKSKVALIAANQDAKLLRVDPDTTDPQLPPLYDVKSDIVSRDKTRAMLAVRDPRVRVEMIKKEGGTTLTEAAVARGLKWMSQHQNPDGSWGLKSFNRCAGCKGQCKNPGGLETLTGGTALVLLPYLGAGQSHLVGHYKHNVSKGLRWLVNHQKSNGDLRAGSQGHSGMYAQGQAAIVLCEAYALTGDEELREAAQKSIDFIVAAQHDAGGWRYQPGQPGDTSVMGWQLMALQSARAAHLNVPDQTFELAGHFLDSVQHDGGSQYAYVRGHQPTYVMTAEGLLCRMYLGWKLEDPALMAGVEFLTNRHAPSSGGQGIYYWYYGTQVMHHVGGKNWEKWNERMREILITTQDKTGHQAGSWPPVGGHSSQGGRLYMTSLATCTLEVYYRHAPIFRQIKLD